MWRNDRDVDALHSSRFREISPMSIQGDLTYKMGAIQHLRALAILCQNIERMGDHATNIAETV